MTSHRKQILHGTKQNKLILRTYTCTTTLAAMVDLSNGAYVTCFLIFVSAGADDDADVDTPNQWCAVLGPAILVLAGHECVWGDQTQNTDTRCRRRRE